MVGITSSYTKNRVDLPWENVVEVEGTDDVLSRSRKIYTVCFLCKGLKVAIPILGE